MKCTLRKEVVVLYVQVPTCNLIILQMKEINADNYLFCQQCCLVYHASFPPENKMKIKLIFGNINILVYYRIIEQKFPPHP